MLRGHKQNLVCLRTKGHFTCERVSGDPHRRLSQTWVWLECLRVSCGGTSQQQPAVETEALATAVWVGTVSHKSSWRRLPWAPLQSHRAGDSQTGEQSQQRRSHTVAEVLRPTTDFSTWGSLRNLTLKVSRIWLQTFLRTGETDSWRAQTKPWAHQDQEKGVVTPPETEPDVPVSVQESLVDGSTVASEGSGALAAAVLGGLACRHKSFWRRLPLLPFPLP